MKHHKAPSFPVRHLFIALAALLSTGASRAAEPALTLKDNDVWVMAGDSITAQRMHTNYIEAYYRTRYPKLKLHFHNSGIGGNRTGSVLARFDYDVAAWKPTIVSIELGMNDVSGGEDTYINGMKELIAKIRAIHAQPVLISSSPVDDGSVTNDWKSDRCAKIHPFTNALKKLATDEKVMFVDQYHQLLDLWGQNRRKGAEAAAARDAGAPKPAPVATIAGRPAPAKPGLPSSLIPLGGDAVHPGAVGQYTMAAAILKDLKAEGEVSSVTLSADGKAGEAKGCKISDVSANAGKLSFTRLDDVSPWPILPGAKSAIGLFPQILKLSEYTLRVSGLPEGNYRVSINGKPAATVSAKDLAAGWNATTAFDGALGERSTKILGLIGTLQSKLNSDWRAASKEKSLENLAAAKEKDAAKLGALKAKNAQQFATAQKAIEVSEKEIQAAVQPEPLHFEIEKENR